MNDVWPNGHSLIDTWLRSIDCTEETSACTGCGQDVGDLTPEQLAITVTHCTCPDPHGYNAKRTALVQPPMAPRLPRRRTDPAAPPIVDPNAVPLPGLTEEGP